MASDSDERLRSKYEIAKPISYPAFSLDSPAKASPESQSDEKQITSESVKPHDDWSDANKASALFEAAAAVDKKKERDFVAGDAYSGVDRRAPREKRAVWIVHGMGEQIPFETVDTLTRGVIDAVKPGHLTRKPRLRTVNIGGQVIQRVELDIQGAQTDRHKPAEQYELHLYESYWAPKTEGVAKLTDVMSFFVAGRASRAAQLVETISTSHVWRHGEIFGFLAHPALVVRGVADPGGVDGDQRRDIVRRCRPHGRAGPECPARQLGKTDRAGQLHDRRSIHLRDGFVHCRYEQTANAAIVHASVHRGGLLVFSDHHGSGHCGNRFADGDDNVSEMGHKRERLDHESLVQLARFDSIVHGLGACALRPD